MSAKKTALTTTAEEYLQANKIQDEHYQGDKFPFEVSEETAREYARLYHQEKLSEAGAAQQAEIESLKAELKQAIEDAEYWASAYSNLKVKIIEGN